MCRDPRIRRRYGTVRMDKHTLAARFAAYTMVSDDGRQDRPVLFQVAVGETVILLQPPLPLAGVSIAMRRERQQNESLADGYFQVFPPGARRAHQPPSQEPPREAPPQATATAIDTAAVNMAASVKRGRGDEEVSLQFLQEVGDAPAFKMLKTEAEGQDCD